ncbi:MAG: FimD/PapC N-terminal domain-containing protein, partial [Alloalcanivorax xenomutans]
MSAGAQLLGGLALLTWTQAVLAQTGTQVAAASFNSDFLRGAAKDMDVSRYAQGNPTLAGDYYLDVYVNGSWKGRNVLAFRAAPGEINAHTC